MSEDKTTAVEETVSETPATETSQEALIEKLQAEQAYSKTQRRKKQDAVNRLAELEKSLAKAEEDKLKKKEEYQTLYEQASSKVESLSANAEKWAKYEETKRNSLLENHPEEDQEKLKDLPLETLEYITSKIQNVKPNAPEVVGTSKAKTVNKSFTKMNAQEKRDNWSDILKSYKNN